MSDTSAFIPGITDKYKSNEAIQKIMESKKVKLTKMENERDDLKEKRSSLNEIKEKALVLQDIVKKLYGFESPFDDKISQSGDPDAFAVNVTRNADIGEYKLKIIQKASSHKIASSSLDRKHKVDPGIYIIESGNEKYRLNFSGGTLEKFADEINKQTKDKLKAFVTFNTSNTQVLLLETGDTGKKNFISFSDDKTKKLFKDMGFFEEVPLFDKRFVISKERLEALSAGRDPEIKKEGALVLRPQEIFKYNLPEKIMYRDRLVMEIDIGAQKIDKGSDGEPVPGGPNYRRDGDLELFGIFIEGERPLVDIPQYEKPKEPRIVEDDHYLEIVTDKRTVKLNELNVGEKTSTLKFDMNDIISREENIVSVIFKNNNTGKAASFENIRFYDEGSQKGLRFLNEISSAEDAKLMFNGIEVERPGNSIDDLIKGATLYVFDKTEKEVSLKIDRDYEKIVKSLMGFIKEYNEFLAMLNKKTAVEPDADGRTGDFSGDYSFSNMISKLRTIVMNAYPTSGGDSLSMINQIGISTNAAAVAGVDRTKLKGYLEANENRLLDTIEKNPRSIKEFFGSDTDGDLVIDTGMAFEMEKLLKAYTLRNQGFFDARRSTIDVQIQGKDKEIESYETVLKDEEQKLREKFYKMEKAAGELEENMKRFDNFNKNR